MFYTVIVVYSFHPSCDSSSSRYRFCHSKPEGGISCSVFLRFLVATLCRNDNNAGHKVNDNAVASALLSFRTYVRRVVEGFARKNLCHSLFLRFLVAALTRNRRSPPAGAKGNDITRGFVICYNHPNSSAKSFFEGLLAAISKSFFSLLQAFISFSLAIASSTQLYSSK